MKIAVCLSGHLRSFQKTTPSLYSFLLRNLDYDIFIHTWDTLGYHNNWRPDHNFYINNYTHSNLNLIQNILKPKQIIIQSQKELESFKKEAETKVKFYIAPDIPKHPGHMFAMFYKIWACNELRKQYERDHNIQYDLIIRTRPDLQFLSLLNTQELLDSKKYLYVPEIEGYGGINDQFAFGSGHLIDYYCGMYNHLSRYFSEGGDFRPEIFVKWHLETIKVPYKLSKIKYFINRS